MKCPHCGKEIGSEKSGEEKNAPKYTAEFEAFWKSYPTRVGKGAAWRAWGKIAPRNGLSERITRSVEAHKQSDRWRAGFVPNPATFLNQRRWEDEVATGASDPFEKFANE